MVEIKKYFRRRSIKEEEKGEGVLVREHRSQSSKGLEEQNSRGDGQVGGAVGARVHPVPSLMLTYYSMSMQCSAMSKVLQSIMYRWIGGE
jgi:hypothetical protein